MMRDRALCRREGYLVDSEIGLDGMLSWFVMRTGLVKRVGDGHS